MDWGRFRLARPPFAAAPDVAGFVPVAAHEAALGHLRAAFADGCGLALLDGDPGTGKSLLALRFLAGLPAGLPRVLVPAAKFARPADLHQALLFDMGGSYRGLSETELRLEVADRLLTALAAGTPAVVVLDEAQHLSDEVLEEVRLLGNLSGHGATAFVLLVAQPGLRARLAGAGLAGLAQRLSARRRLDPLPPDDSARLVRDRLAAAGGRPGDLVDDEALGLLAAHARGVPRLLVQAAAAAFAAAAEAGASTVDVEAVLEGLTRVGLYDEPPGVLPHPAKEPAARRPRKRKSA